MALARIVRLDELLKWLGVSRSTLYLWIANGTFPKQVPLGARAVGWIESEVKEWLDRQIERSREEVKP